MASGPDCISVVILNNFMPELLSILAKLFNMCLKGFCFPDSWKVSSVVPVFKNVFGKGLQLKATSLLFLFL